jgi:4-aminobutyrate aminotransferase-like enzyme
MPEPAPPIAGLAPATSPDAALDALLARRDRLFGPGAPLFYQRPLHLVRGEGVWLHDADGRRYLDLYNNIPVVGHANPRVVAALAGQAARHWTHSRYLDARILDYAQRLVDLHDPSIGSVVFTCTGTEANEVAMQMARIATGGRGFVCTTAAYHGHSALVGSLTRAPRRGRPDVHAIAYPQRYRPLADGLDAAGLVRAHLDEVRAAIADFDAAGVPLAGMLVCPIFANEGLPEPLPGFLPQAARLVREAGGLLIVDEVQSGFCRTGRWWAYQGEGVVPDIVTTGKPMGNGMPMGACAARPDLVARFRAAGRYFNTFAGSPVHAAAGLAVLDEIEDRGLAAKAAAHGAWLLEALREIAINVQAIGDVRGRGLFIAIEWVHDRTTRAPDREGAVAMVNRLRDAGALIGHAGEHGNVLKIRPPLVFEREHAEYFVALFKQALERTATA